MTATRLGHLAALPFVVGAALVGWGGGALRAPAMHALVAYAAIVALFVGAIHWGLGFAQGAWSSDRQWAWGVLPAIVAWLSLLATPAVGLAVNATVLVACYLVDRVLYPQHRVERWLPLRLRLTVVAASSCAIAAAAA